MPKAKEKLALSFDVECYYQIVAKDHLSMKVSPTDEVVRTTTWIFDELKKYNARASFFFLGNIADNYPELVKRAVEDGHEIGIHGYDHHYINQMSQAEFENEIELGAKAILKAGAKEIVGHRAPAFSIDRKNIWALDVLKTAGMKYDSSIFPIKGSRYGEPNWSTEPSFYSNGIYEIPMSVIHLFGRRVPAMGGGYVRYFPYWWTKFCATRLAKKNLTPITYFHPYEFALSNPILSRFPIDGASDETLKKLKKFNFLQSIGRGKSMRRKLTKMIQDNEAIPLGELLPV